MTGTLDAAWLRAFRRRLPAWYARHARNLPWRKSGDPYRVWLSEIMLQQTQVETVKPYFERFLAALPTLAALAAADQQQVLRLWEGLGYYRRAQQLHKAAQAVVARHGGQFPCDPETVQGVPGIGRYTAGAILSIAFDQRLPILEANTLRLWSRLLAYPGDPASAAGQKLLWAAAERVLPRRGAGVFNQALMDLGSTICRPREPRCDGCPVAVLCRAHALGRQAEIPRPKPKPPPEEVHEAAVLVRRRGRVLLIRWPAGRRWAGLWDFPRFPLHAAADAGLTADITSELMENVLRLCGVRIRPREHVRTLRHGVTRFRITLDCYAADYVAGPRQSSELTTMEWVRPDGLDRYPLSSSGRKLAQTAAGATRSGSP